MSTKKVSSTEVSVPMAAMIDVVFLLLIYFIVTIKTTIDQAWVAVSLPGPSIVNSEPKAQIDIDVQSGHYLYQNNKSDLAQLENVFRNIKDMNDDELVINIRVSQQARHHKLVDLLDSLSKVGLENFNLHSLKDSLSL